jgi:hypothetical protein
VHLCKVPSVAQATCSVIGTYHDHVTKGWVCRVGGSSTEGEKARKEVGRRQAGQLRYSLHASVPSLSEGDAVSHAPSLAGARFFSLTPWLLLDITGLN